MKKLISGVVVAAFSMLLCTSLLNVFSGDTHAQKLAGSFQPYPYSMTY